MKPVRLASSKLL